MAGLGETCSYAASFLFYLEAFHRTRETKSCTQEQGKWLLPRAIKDVPYLPIAEIDFKGATRNMRDLNCSTEDGNNNKTTKRKKTEEPLQIENGQRQREFLSKLRLCCTRPAISPVIEPYNESFTPVGSITNLFFKICTLL